jgi:hypothetical protein
MILLLYQRDTTASTTPKYNTTGSSHTIETEVLSSSLPQVHEKDTIMEVPEGEHNSY